MENTKAKNESTGFDFGQFLKNNAVKIIAITFWLIIVIAIVIFQQSIGLGASELAADLTTRLQESIAGTWWGPIAYTFVYFLRPVILFPASVLTILGGNLYGLAVGLPIVVFAGTVSAIIPYFAGRWLFGSATEAEEENEEIGRLMKFAEELRNNPFQTVITMRLLFLPYDGASIFAGSLKVPFVPFFVATLLGNVIGAIPYVALGASVEGNPFMEDVSLDPRILALAGVTLVLSIAGSQIYKRYQARKEAQQAAATEQASA
ncbi:MAG: VTT domain-containing protein [Chloroflexota bacterium]